MQNYPIRSEQETASHGSAVCSLRPFGSLPGGHMTVSARHYSYKHTHTHTQVKEITLRYRVCDHTH